MNTDTNRIVRMSFGNTFNLLKIQEEEGRRGRKDLGNIKQVLLEGSETGKLA